MLPIEPPFKVYTGLDGKPLDSGFIYFGHPGQDPANSAHRVTVYWDQEGTTVAEQPLRTMNGYIVRDGTPANVYYGSEYSILVQDKKRQQVFFWTALKPEIPDFSELQTVATEGQKVFTLEKVAYTPGIGSLHIYVDGIRVYMPDYAETARDTVTFTAGLRKGQEVLFETGSSLRVVVADEAAEASAAKAAISETNAKASEIAAAESAALAAASETNALGSEDAAAASAAAALGYLITTRVTSYGARTEDPATDPAGNPPQAGDEYFNTTVKLLKRYNGAVWQASDINTGDLAAPLGSTLIGYGERNVEDKLREIVSAEDHFMAGESDSTAMIQRAIDAMHAAGGGNVMLGPLEYLVSTTSLPLPVLLVSSDGELNPTTTLTQSCLVLRSGVTLVGRGRGVTTIRAPAIERCVITLYEMNGGGLRDLSVAGGKGVCSHVSNFDADMCNLVIDNIEIYESSGYGLGMQYGFNYNNRYSRLHIHDTGQDAFDHKARARPETGELPYGNSIRSCLLERYGQTSSTESAGIDIRGQMILDDIVCRQFSAAGKKNRGVRFSTGITKANDKRVGSDRSSISNFYIDSGNPADTGVIGLEILEAGHLAIANGTIENCYTGLATNESDTGSGLGSFTRVVNVTVFGSRDVAFRSGEEECAFVGCKAIAAEDYFSEQRANLVVGQDVLTVARTFDPETVKVWRNGAVLTLNSDYTVTGIDTVTLILPSASGDVFMVETPTLIGFNFTTRSTRSAINNSLIGCSAKGTIKPVSADPTSLSTLAEIGNNFGLGGIRAIESGGPVRLEAHGPSPNMDFRVDAKGSGVFEARSNGARAFVASSPVNAVNWISSIGAVADGYVRLDAAGSSTNIPLRLAGKGSGSTSIATRIGDPVSSGDVSFTRASDTQVLLKMRGSDGVVRSVTLNLA